MSRRYMQSPPTPYLSPVKSQSQFNKTILAQLFSKQFLGCLKDELNSKLKQSRPIESQYKDAINSLHTYKKQLQKTRIKIEQLTLKNNQLSTKLRQYQSKNIAETTNSTQINNKTSERTSKKLDFSKVINLNITQHLYLKDQEINNLKQRIQKLQVQKSVKQQRLNEMMQKQVRYDSLIKFLRIKNCELEQQVKNLKQAIVIQSQDDKPLKQTQINKSIVAFSCKYSLQSGKNSQQSNKNPSHLIASSTYALEIPESMNLSKLYRKKYSCRQQQFNQIDYIISQELPYLKVTDQLKQKEKERQKQRQLSQRTNSIQSYMNNLNQSIVTIDLSRR